MIALSFLAACKNDMGNAEHPRYFSHILKIADTLHGKYADRAIYILDSTLNTLPQLNTGDTYIKDSVKVIIYSFAKNDYVKALQYADSMIMLVQDKLDEEKYAERYVRALYIKGTCFRNLKNYYGALHYYKIAEEATLKLVKNKCNVAEFRGAIADLMFKQEKYLSAAAYFLKQHAELASGCNTDKYRHMRDLEASFNNAALSYLRAGVLDSAAFYQQKALQIILADEHKFPADSFNIAYAKAVIYADQAEILTLTGNYAEAEKLYKKSIEGTSAADIQYTQKTQVRLATAYLDNNMNNFAESTLTDLKKSLDTTTDNEHQLLSWYNLTARYYRQTNQSNIAAEYQSKYYTLKDSAALRDKQFQAEDIGKEFENLELKYFNEVLQKENKLKSLYLAIAIIIFGMSAVFGAFIWHNLKRTGKLHRELAYKNADMQQTLSALEQSNQKNNRIMRIVAHDLINPVSAISNMVYGLLKENQTDQNKETLTLIKSACGNSLTLIHEILNEGENTIAHRDLVNMKKLLEYSVGLLHTKADEKKQTIYLQAEDASILLDEEKMLRVINNILTNAIKFSPEHGIITISLKKEEAGILLSVQDNGMGIPAALKDQLFTASGNNGRQGTHGEKSHGLGLFISQKIIEEHGGTLWFESEDGKGAVFYVRLPYHANQFPET